MLSTTQCRVVKAPRLVKTTLVADARALTGGLAGWARGFESHVRHTGVSASQCFALTGIGYPRAIRENAVHTACKKKIETLTFVFARSIDGKLSMDRAEVYVSRRGPGRGLYENIRTCRAHRLEKETTLIISFAIFFCTPRSPQPVTLELVTGLTFKPR